MKYIAFCIVGCLDEDFRIPDVKMGEGWSPVRSGDNVFGGPIDEVLNYLYPILAQNPPGHFGIAAASPFGDARIEKYVWHSRSVSIVAGPWAFPDHIGKKYVADMVISSFLRGEEQLQSMLLWALGFQPSHIREEVLLKALGSGIVAPHEVPLKLFEGIIPCRTNAARKTLIKDLLRWGGKSINEIFEGHAEVLNGEF